jgi:DNA-binding CsgD family transcriptional regulator
MKLLSNIAIDLIEKAGQASSAAEVGRLFFAALKPYGVRALYARAHVSPELDREYIFSRISPPGWEESYEDGKFDRYNFLPREARRRARSFVWSEVARPDSDDQKIFPILSAFSMSDGLGVPVHAPGGYVGITSIAFERMDKLTPEERLAIAFAALTLHLRVRELVPAAAMMSKQLSPRERDCLGHVADGMGDFEISEALGVGEATVITHLQNAKRKLGARTRAQAVALALRAGLI